MAVTKVELKTDGNTLTVQTTNCDGTPSLSPAGGTPTVTKSGSMVTYTFTGLTDNTTYTVTVNCMGSNYTSQVTIPSDTDSILSPS